MRITVRDIVWLVTISVTPKQLATLKQYCSEAVGGID